MGCVILPSVLRVGLASRPDYDLLDFRATKVPGFSVQPNELWPISPIAHHVTAFLSPQIRPALVASLSTTAVQATSLTICQKKTSGQRPIATCTELSRYLIELWLLLGWLISPVNK
jgi:hypothetical protein